MALDPDGRSVWVSGLDASRIVLYPSVGSETTPVVYRLPPGSSPHGIVFGRDGPLYIALTGTNIGGNAIGRLDRDGSVRVWPLPSGAGAPWGTAVGPEGKIWFTEIGSGKVGRLEAGNRVFRISVDGRATEFPVPTPDSVPVAIAPGRGGVLWASELSGGKLLRISLAGKMREFPLPQGARPYGVAAAPDGNVWFADRG